MKEDIKRIAICLTERNKREKVKGGKKENKSINNLIYMLVLIDSILILHLGTSGKVLSEWRRGDPEE